MVNLNADFWTSKPATSSICSVHCKDYNGQSEEPDVVILLRKVCLSSGQIRSISWLFLVLSFCQAGIITSQFEFGLSLLEKIYCSHCGQLINSFLYSAELSLLTRLTLFLPFFPFLYPSSKCDFRQV